MKIYVFSILFFLHFFAQGQDFSNEDFAVFNRYCVDFRTGNLPIKVNGSWGFENEQGQEVISPKYDSVLYAGLGICLAKNKLKTDVINQELEVLRSFKTGEVFFDFECHSIRYKKNGEDRYLDYVNYTLLDSTISQSCYSRRLTTRFKLYDFIPDKDFDSSYIRSISYNELIRKKLFKFDIEYVDGTHTIFDSVNYFSLENAPYFMHGPDDLEVFDMKNKSSFSYRGFQYQDICQYDGVFYFLFKKSDICVVLDEEKNVQLMFRSPSKRVSFERSSGYVYAGSKLDPQKIIFFPTLQEVQGEFAIINGSTRNFLRAETEDSIFYYDKGLPFLAFKTDLSGESNYGIDFDETDHLLKVKDDENYFLYSSTGKVLLRSVSNFDIVGDLIEHITPEFKMNYYLYNSCLDELIEYEGSGLIPFGRDQYLNFHEKTVVGVCGEILMDELIQYKSLTRAKSGNRIVTLKDTENRRYLHSRLKFLPIEEDVYFERMISLDRNPQYVMRNDRYLGRHFKIIDKEKALVGAVDDEGNVIRFRDKTFIRVNHFGAYYFLIDSIGNYEYVRF